MLFIPVATFIWVWPCFSYYVLATYMYCCLILIACSCKIIMAKKLCSSSRYRHERVYTHYFSCFTIIHKQLILPSALKAAKVGRLQLTCKPGSSSSQRALLLNTSNLRMQLHPFFSSPVSNFRHFPVLCSSFLVLSVPAHNGVYVYVYQCMAYGDVIFFAIHFLLEP